MMVSAVIGSAHEHQGNFRENVGLGDHEGPLLIMIWDLARRVAFSSRMLFSRFL